MSKEPFERPLETVRLLALTKVVMDLLILEHELNFSQVISVLLNAMAMAIASSNVSEEELNEFLQGLFERLKKITFGYVSEAKNIKEEKK